MRQLNTLTAKELHTWATQAQSTSQRGLVMQRIQRLAAASSDWLGVQITCGTGETHWFGAVDRTFPLMSVIKPFLLLYLLEQHGWEQVFQWVGMEPSEYSFNSLEQLMADRGRPRNPMINSGAIVLAEKLPGADSTASCQQFCQWLNQRAGCRLSLDALMLASVRQAGREPNQALVKCLVNAQQLTAGDRALDSYEQICCLTGRVADLAQLGLLLAIEQGQVGRRHRQAVNAMMLTCGLYTASSQAAVEIGLPTKSGISGALVAVIPQQGSIACYSPSLDAVGNPIAGLTVLRTIAHRLELSVFG